MRKGARWAKDAGLLRSRNLPALGMAAATGNQHCAPLQAHPAEDTNPRHLAQEARLRMTLNNVITHL
jgi:hypothetical protein